MATRAPKIVVVGGQGRCFVVKVAQLVRALDCGSRGRGFKSPLSPLLLSGYASVVSAHKKTPPMVFHRQAAVRYIPA